MPPRKAHPEVDQSFEASCSSDSSLACNYTVISYYDRIKLIEKICVEKQQIATVAASLGIKLSTAKYILRCFRKYGKILKKTSDRKEDHVNMEGEVEALKQKVLEINKKEAVKKMKSPKRAHKHPYQAPTLQKKQTQLQKVVRNTQASQQDQEHTSTDAKMLANADSSGTKTSINYILLYNPFWSQNLPNIYCYGI